MSVGLVRAVLRHQVLEGLAVVEAGERLVGYADLEEITQRLPALPDLVDQQPVAGYVAAHLLDVPLEVGDGGGLILKVCNHLGPVPTFYEGPSTSSWDRRFVICVSSSPEGFAIS